MSPNPLCAVCDGRAHCMNFGAVTCRACAAFFRRSHFALVPYSQIMCRMGDDSCFVNPNSDSVASQGKLRCKKCRFTRCLAAGMTTSNIRVPRSVETVLGVPHPIIFLRREQPYLATFIDVNYLLQSSTSLCLNLQSHSHQSPEASNLHQLTLGLSAYRQHQAEHVVELPVLTNQICMDDWQRVMQAAARWLNYSSWFRSMATGRKVALWRAVWFVWGKVDQMAMTAKMRVNRLCGQNHFVFTSHSFIDFDRVHAETDWCSSYDYRELCFIITSREMFYDHVICEMMRVQPDDTEMTFLICTICFQLTGKVVGGETRQDTDMLQDMLSNDLHNYYRQRHFTVYSYRLRQLLGIKEMFLKHWNMRMEKIRLAFFFNILRFNFSDQQFLQIIT